MHAGDTLVEYVLIECEGLALNLSLFLVESAQSFW